MNGKYVKILLWANQEQIFQLHIAIMFTRYYKIFC